MVWYELKNLRQSDSDEISAEIQVPPDSFWFSGHFPGEPILPGIAQLGMVFDAINQSKRRNLKICSISRVRFKQLIRPNDLLRVFASLRKDYTGSYNFRIMAKEELVCSGVMKVETRTGHSKGSPDTQP
jgi:3-hydroxyacyl-[acyl-carrier-protein] dehydratase